MKRVISHVYDAKAMTGDEAIARFETEAARYLRDSRAEDVGAVILYYRGKREIAYMDYENRMGSVRELMTDAEYNPWEFAD